MTPRPRTRANPRASKAAPAMTSTAVDLTKAEPVGVAATAVLDHQPDEPTEIRIADTVIFRLVPDAVQTPLGWVAARAWLAQQSDSQ